MSTAPFAQEKITVILGTATPGGGFPVYGDAMVEIVNAADASLSLQPRTTKGSTYNPTADVHRIAGSVTWKSPSPEPVRSR